ncbi:MAG: hypothetical protein PHH16_03860 [Candidatus Gracilibacteria bacterium]|nr:hypothetical protein [Candidatus Gracilibacteria bacterium]
MDPNRIIIIGAGYYNPGFIYRMVECLSAEMDIHPVIVHPRFHPHDPSFVPDALEYHDTGKKDVPLFSIHNQEEEIQEMGKSLLVLVIGNALASRTQFIGTAVHTSAVLGALASEKTGFDRPPTHERHHRRKHSVRMEHTAPLKLKVPRGIHRDNHGRPQKQKLTPARASRRNGSR